MLAPYMGLMVCHSMLPKIWCHQLFEHATHTQPSLIASTCAASTACIVIRRFTTLQQCTAKLCSAVVSMIEPHWDTSYVCCSAMLDLDLSTYVWTKTHCFRNLRPGALQMRRSSAHRLLTWSRHVLANQLTIVCCFTIWRLCWQGTLSGTGHPQSVMCPKAWILPQLVYHHCLFIWHGLLQGCSGGQLLKFIKSAISDKQRHNSIWPIDGMLSLHICIRLRYACHVALELGVMLAVPLLRCTRAILDRHKSHLGKPRWVA